MDIEVKNKLNPLVYPSQTISMDKVDGEWSSYISVRIDNSDRSFSLESDMSRIVTVEVQVGEATLINLPSDTLTVNFTVYATATETMHRLRAMDDLFETSYFGLGS